jgi:hypothetical protein
MEDLVMCQGENRDGRTRVLIESMGEMAAYLHGGQGVLAERLAGHETLL